jgi:hypothetical protein
MFKKNGLRKRESQSKKILQLPLKNLKSSHRQKVVLQMLK